jgi:outer membrane receptor protein involved in Fe transport
MVFDRLSQRFGLALFLVGALMPAGLLANGRLEGRVTGPDGGGLSGVSVLITETSAATLTDSSGRFSFDNVPPGTFNVTFALGGRTLTIPDVRIENAIVYLDQAVDWNVSFADTITVYAASLRAERPFEAPASVAVVDESAIAREAAHAQVPKVLASTVGVEVTQSGMFDFNVNIRGLNAALNRRVLTLLDGRDAAAVLVGAQEWAAVALPEDEIARVEVVRGPGSALYGANAFNGVIDMTSKEPRYSPGGNVQFSFGENATRRVSMRQAGAFGRDWFYRAQAAYGRTGDFFTSRTTSVEYPGLPSEVVSPATDRTEFVNTGARLDRYLSTNSLFTVEGGWARADGNVILTGAGRPQNRGVQRPWVRSGLQTSRWRVSGYYDGRKGQMLSLSVGNTIVDDSMKLHGEAQRRFDYAAGRGRVVAGGAYRYERADTRDDAGVSTILRGVHAARTGAFYGQLDHDLGARVRVVVAARFDDSTLHEPQFSPKAGIVHAISPTQSVRFTYGHAFQTGSFVQYFTRVAAAPPVRLGALEAALAPALGGTALGFGSVPVLALGNDELRVERMDSFETGYSGVFASKVTVGVDYYFNRVNDLITALLPQVGTSLGRINPQFGAYQPPSGLSATQQGLVVGALKGALPPSLFAALSNDLDGLPIFVVASYTNLARVNLQGTEFSVRYFATDRVMADAGFAWQNFATKKDLPEEPVSANAPPRSARAGLTYADTTKSAAFRYRWSDRFMWIGGIFRGPVPSYGVADLSASYTLPWRARVSLNIANLFDNKHYEIFGGDILRRSALVTLAREW